MLEERALRELQNAVYATQLGLGGARGDLLLTRADRQDDTDEATRTEVYGRPSTLKHGEPVQVPTSYLRGV